MTHRVSRFAKAALGLLALVVAFTPVANAVDWTGTKSIGAFVGFDQYAVAPAPIKTTQIQGISFLYGLNDRWRLGGDFGLAIISGGSSPSITNTEFLLAPLAEYDIISKPSGSFYGVGRLLNYSSQNAAVGSGGGSTKAWALNFITVGAGLEALISQDFSVYFEGDVLRLGQTGATGSSVSDVGFFLFPGIRTGMKMYFGGSENAGSSTKSRSSGTSRF